MNFKILNPSLTKLLQGAKVGDMVHTVALPVARALNLSCLDDNRKLRPDSPCAKRRAILNGELFGAKDVTPKP